jgi:hypothetical protein
MREREREFFRLNPTREQGAFVYHPLHCVHAFFWLTAERLGLGWNQPTRHLAPAAITTPHYSIVNCAFLFCFSLSHFADSQDVANTI